MLIQAIHSCAVKFPDVASSVVDVLMDFLGDTNVASAVDVITFVRFYYQILYLCTHISHTFCREVVETYENLKESILKKLLICLGQIRASKVCFRNQAYISKSQPW